MGNELLKSITEMTGLPDSLIEPELAGIIEQHGFSSSEITLDQLRDVLASYLREVIQHAKTECEQ